MCLHHVSFTQSTDSPFPYVFETEGQVICMDLIQIIQMNEWCQQILNQKNEEDDDEYNMW